MDIILPYKPSDRQALFHRAPQRFKLYGGAMGGGKSYALCAEAIALSLDYPGNYGYLARHELTSFKKTTMLTFFMVCPPQLIAKYDKSDHYVEFINGSIIQFGDLENTEKLKSMNLGWFGIDEASETTDAVFKILNSRLRLDLPGIQYFALAASNPEPGWVKDRWIDGVIPGTYPAQKLKNPDSYIFVRSLPSDNPNLPADYIQSQTDNADDDWVRRYIEGDWSTFEGQIYKGFSRGRNVVKPFTIPSHWQRYRSIDFGEQNPTACIWVAVDPDGNWWIYDEYYAINRTTKDHAETIIMKTHNATGRLPINGTVGDANALGAQLILDYNTFGLNVIEQLRHTVTEGINRVKEKLNLNPITEKPSLFVFDTCANVIKEFETYQWDDRSRTDVVDPKERPLKKDDHLMDCLRNFAMTFFYSRPLTKAEEEERRFRSAVSSRPKVSSITGY